MKFSNKLPENFPKTSIIKKAWHQSAIYAVGTFLLSFGQIALAPLLTRRFSVAEFGSYEILLVTYIALKTLLIVPLSSALVYGHCKCCSTDGERKSLLSCISLISLILAIAILTAGFLMPRWPSLLIGTNSVLSSIGLLILETLALEVFVQIALGAFRAAQQPFYYGLVALTQLTGTVGLAWIFVGRYAMGIRGVFNAMAVSNLLSFIFMIVFLRNKVSFRPKWSNTKPVINFALTMVPMNVANLILSVSDRYFINRYWDLTTVGVYALSYRIGSGITIFIVLPFLAAWPALIYSERDPAKTAEHVCKAALNLWIVGMLFITVGTSVAKPLLLFFGGGKFLVGAYLVPIISLGGLLYGIIQVFLSLAVARGEIYLNMIVLILSSTACLLLNALMIPKFGMLGAALATVFSYCFGAILACIYVKRLALVKLDVHKWLSCFVIGLLGAVAGRFVDGISRYSPLNFLLTVLLSATIYIAAAKITGLMLTPSLKLSRYR